MSGPDMFAFHFHDGLMTEHGAVSCPTCGERTMLRILIHPAETGAEGDTPAYVRCPVGHVWAEEWLPRGMFAGALADVAAAAPQAWERLLQRAREQGHVDIEARCHGEEG